MYEPYKLSEIDPTKLLIENRLQMIFFNGWSTLTLRLKLFFVVFLNSEVYNFNNYNKGESILNIVANKNVSLLN